MKVGFWKRGLLYLGRAILLVYLLIAAGSFLFFNQLMFHPPAPHCSEPFKKQLIELNAADGNRISAVHFKTEGPSKTLIYSHGNAEDIWDRAWMLSLFQKNGFSVLAYDYPGYGMSTGRPSERGVYAAAEAAYRYLTEEAGVSPEDIIIYGRSIGSGPSCYLAQMHPSVGGLILECGFSSITRVVTRVRILPFEAFPNIRRIGDIHCPVLFIHGDNDEIVPFSHAQKMFERANEPKYRFWVQGGNHADLEGCAGEAYWESLKNFLQTLPPPSRSAKEEKAEPSEDAAPESAASNEFTPTL